MWKHLIDSPIAANAYVPNPRLAVKIANLIGTAPDKGAMAANYLKQRHLAEEDDICEMLTDIAADELSHADILCEIMRGVAPGAGPPNVPLPPALPASDLITGLYLDLYLEQSARASLEYLATLIRETPLQAAIERIIFDDIRHTKRLAEALRLSLFRRGMCDPFLPGEGARTQAFDLNGQSEDIEYYLDQATGRYACRSAG